MRHTSPPCRVVCSEWHVLVVPAIWMSNLKGAEVMSRSGKARTGLAFNVGRS